MKIQDYIDNNLCHRLSYSGIRSFRGCRRRWNWTTNEGYRPIVTPQPLEFGIAFHKAMEYFYEPFTWNNPLEIRRDVAVVAFKQECDAQLLNYKRLNQSPDSTVIESYKSRIELGIGMLRYYCDEMSPKYDKGFKPIRVEVPFEVPIENEFGQLWCKCKRCWEKWKASEFGIKRHDLQVALNDIHYDYLHHEYGYWQGLPVTYRGRIDMLAEDSQGRYWIYDWKTTTRMLDEDAESAFLQLDDQIASYIWALFKLGISVAGFVYVEIKKAFPQPPEPLKRINQGRSYSVSRTAVTTHDMALKTFQQNDNDAWQMGLYDDFLAWLKSDGTRFTMRHQIHKNQNEIEAVGSNLASEALDIINDPRIYPQPGRFSCSTCAFSQPCLGMNMGEDYQYTLATMFEKRERIEKVSTE